MAGVEFACTHLLELPGALFVVVVVTVVGASLSMRIPRWVEVTAGEVPATLSYRQDSGPLRRWGHSPARRRGHLPRVGGWPEGVKKVGGTLRQPLGRNIITCLWGNCTVKVMVGFLFLYPAFVAKAHQANGWVQLGMLGMIGAAAGNLTLEIHGACVYRYKISTIVDLGPDLTALPRRGDAPGAPRSATDDRKMIPGNDFQHFSPYCPNRPIVQRLADQRDDSSVQACVVDDRPAGGNAGRNRRCP